MIIVELSEGKKTEIDAPSTGKKLANKLFPNRIKDIVAIKVQNELWDLSREINSSAHVSFVFRSDEDGLEIIRHDAAHIMAEAVQELYPNTQVTIGPVIENGFYYDFARDKPFSPEDLEIIEKKMHEIVARDELIEREIWKEEKV